MLTTSPTPEDRRYCRAILPRVSRTFALNTRLLDGSMADAVRIAYLLCRTADALEDSWPGTAREIEQRFDVFLTAMAGDYGAAEHLARAAAPHAAAAEDLALVAMFPSVWRVARALPAGDLADVTASVTVLASGMRRYAARAADRAAGAPYLDDEPELHDYCFVVAGCVGEMLTRLHDRRAPVDAPRQAKRLALARDVGEALQLTNILLDWPNDVRRGRCHVPSAWLSAHDLAPGDLVDGSHPAVRDVAARLEGMARTALERVPDYLALVPARHVRYRLFCLWPALWARASLRHARRDPEFPWGRERPRLPKTELWGVALRSLLEAHGDRSLRRLYDACG
jgi:farnesyl-diphosphate farnesyltransferase